VPRKEMCNLEQMKNNILTDASHVCVCVCVCVCVFPPITSEQDDYI
jgi:hypothetical protein